ncbi:MAG: hypothetical protein ACPGRH_07250, partial [Alphaproteobacteria bacterium]
MDSDSTVFRSIVVIVVALIAFYFGRLSREDAFLEQSAALETAVEQTADLQALADQQAQDAADSRTNLEAAIARADASELAAEVARVEALVAIEARSLSEEENASARASLSEANTTIDELNASLVAALSEVAESRNRAENAEERATAAAEQISTLYVARAKAEVESLETNSSLD